MTSNSDSNIGQSEREERDMTCFFRDKHEVEIINDTTLKCKFCKRYFKEVDVNGELIK